MKYIDEFRSPELVAGLIRNINRKTAALDRPVTIMEVCGSHTSAISRFGLRKLLPEKINLVSGPGCPVCVTAIADIDTALWLAAQPDHIFTSYGDLLRVPGSHLNSLEKIRAGGADIKTVHSALEAVTLAQKNPRKKIIFMGIGFETTTPTVAAAILHAERVKIKNFFLLSSHKLMPPVMHALLDEKELNLDAFICPGHVSTIIGADAYNFLIQKGLAAVITGFEPVDILLSISMILDQLTNGVDEVKIQYCRAVKRDGNRKAREIMAEVFQPTSVTWRGLGEIAASGLVLRDKFSGFDARRCFSVPKTKSQTDSACRCGEVLRGIIKPDDCKLFGSKCTPDRPFGPCMVSNEGSCAAYYKG